MSNQACAKTCAGCGAAFTPSSARQLHCDDACANRARQRRHKANLKREAIVVDEVAAGRLDPIAALDWMTDPEGARDSYETRTDRGGYAIAHSGVPLADELAWLSLIERVYDRWTRSKPPACDAAPCVISSSQLVERLDVLARIGPHRIAIRGTRRSEYDLLAKSWRAEQARRREATEAERERRAARWATIQDRNAWEDACDRGMASVTAVVELPTDQEPFALDHGLGVAA